MWHLHRPPRDEPVPPAALAAIDWLGEESVVRSWETHRGWLLLTELRVIFVWAGDGLFTERGWHAGPVFFLFALHAPTVEHARFLRLTGSDGASSRFEFRDPGAVAQALEAARGPGLQEWNRRKAARAVAGTLATSRSVEVRPTFVREVVREYVRVPCRYCGHLVDVGRASCPTCGALLR